MWYRTKRPQGSPHPVERGTPSSSEELGKIWELLARVETLPAFWQRDPEPYPHRSIGRREAGRLWWG